MEEVVAVDVEVKADGEDHEVEIKEAEVGEDAEVVAEEAVAVATTGIMVAIKAVMAVAETKEAGEVVTDPGKIKIKVVTGEVKEARVVTTVVETGAMTTLEEATNKVTEADL